MKKIIILISTLFLLFSCVENNKIEKNNNKKTVEENSYNLDNEDKVFGWKFEKVEKEDLNTIKNDELNLKNIKEEPELEYKEIKDYNKINIFKINEKFILENSLYEKEIFIDLGFSNDRKKMNKIINLVKDISEKNEIKSFILHCNDLNFNNQEIKTLKKLNVNLLSLDSNCGFKKEEFKKTWYNEQKVIKFLKETKKISEIHIWHIDEDYFRKVNWIIEKSDRILNNTKWEKIN